MDKRKKYFIGLDTETCNGIMVNDKLDLTQSIVYDIGWNICDKKGNIYKTRSFVVYESFCGMSDVMKSAYYAEKIPNYWKEIKEGKRTIAKFLTIWKAFKEDVKEYNINTVFAHNARFDLRALNNSIRYFSKSKYRYFFSKNLEIWDTLKMARQTIGKQKSYCDYCKRNGYMTKHKIPQVRLTAEILFRYISGNADFIESHTGLEDVTIETKIMVHCLRQHKKMECRLFA